MKTLIHIFFASMVALTTFVASAQTVTLPIATGAKGLTYSRFFDELAQVCPAPAMRPVATDGSRTNLDKLVGNEVALAFMQEDVLFARKLIDNDPQVDSVRVLVPLYREEVHVLVPNSSQIHQFTDLGNKKVVSFGGGMITSRVLFGQTGVRPIQLIDGHNFATALSAISGRGSVVADAILFVSGQPSDDIKRLPIGQYRLVPIKPTDATARAYSTATLNYSNLSNSGVPTLSTRSFIATMNYEGGTMVAPLQELRSCIAANIVKLRETPGFHSKWRAVNLKEDPKWPSFKAGASGQQPKQTKKSKK